MKFCQSCGTQILDEAAFCPNCGCAVAAEPAPQAPMGQAPMGQAPMGQAPMGQMPMGQMPMGQMPVEPAETSGLATCSIVFAILMPIVGLILGIVGCVKYKTPALKKRCTIAIIISIVVWALGFISLMGM